MSIRGPRTTPAPWHPLGSHVGIPWHLLNEGDHTRTCPVSRCPEYEARVLQDTLPLCPCACCALGIGGRGLELPRLQAWCPPPMPYASYHLGTLAWPGTHFGVEGSINWLPPPHVLILEVRLYCPLRHLLCSSACRRCGRSGALHRPGCGLH